MSTQLRIVLHKWSRDYTAPPKEESFCVDLDQLGKELQTFYHTHDDISVSLALRTAPPTRGDD